LVSCSPRLGGVIDYWLDLCAAAFGRVFCGHQAQREHALAVFAKPTKRTHVKLAKRMKRRRAQLPPLGRRWVKKVFADHRYKEIKTARDWPTHSRMMRHFKVATGHRNNPRLQLGLPSTQVGVHQLILAAYDMATQHLSRCSNLSQFNSMLFSAKVSLGLT
jgi:hypothetical protein